MISRQKHRPLRDTDIISDKNFVEIIDPDIFANPAIISNLQIPRCFDSHFILDNYPFPNLSSKHSQ